MAASDSDQAVMNTALNAVLSKIVDLPVEQRMTFLESLLNVAFQLLRVGGENDEFVRGMLMGAMKDLDGSALIPMSYAGIQH